MPKMVTDSLQEAKKKAAKTAAALIEPGMWVGLGTGSTVAYLLQELGRRCREGLQIQALTSSYRTWQQAAREGIPLSLSSEIRELDLTVDGADAVDPQQRLIKGGGGALLREKILAKMARELIIIIDPSKQVEDLRSTKLPVEILPFGKEATLHQIRKLGCVPHLRQNYLTDNGNFIADCDTSGYSSDLLALDEQLHRLPGVIETGLFASMATKVIVGGRDEP